MTEEVLQSLSDDPMAVLNRGYRAKERIAARQERIEEWRQIAESITANPENASSGGGYPTSKTENCVVAIVTLQEEIKGEIIEITDFERQTFSDHQGACRGPELQDRPRASVSQLPAVGGDRRQNELYIQMDSGASP